MNIIILGAGAIGSLYGAKLSKLNKVALIARKGHADSINKNGLKITGLENKVYSLKAITKINKIKDNTLIILATKIYDAKNSILSIKNEIKSDTVILCLQNGLNSEDIVKGIVEDKCLVLRGITSFGAAFLEDGIVQYNNYGYTIIEKSPKSNELTENFTKCGLSGNVSGDIKVDVWKKLVLNCVINPLTAILRVENKGVADEKLDSLKKLIINECIAVAEREGIKLNIDFLKIINEDVKNSRNISSMQQDIIKGKKTEIDYLNGIIVELGRKHGIKCHVNEGLVAIIREMESKI